MSAPRSMHLPSGVPKRPGVRRSRVRICISRYQTSVAFAGGASTDGVWGSKRRVTGVAGVTIDVN